MGVQLSSEEMTILFDEFDTSGDKIVEFREFNTMVRECLAGSDVDSESSHSTTSYSGSSVGSSLKSMFSSDSQALRKHPLILQVLWCPFPACGRSFLTRCASSFSFWCAFTILTVFLSQTWKIPPGASQRRQSAWKATSRRLFPVLGADIRRYVTIGIYRTPHRYAVLERKFCL